MDDRTKQDYEVVLLKLEYEQCQDGYNHRDNMVEDEFCKLVQLFLFLVATVFLFDRFADVSRFVHCLGCAVLGIAGFFCFFSLLVSIESNASCNVALRKRCGEIEKRLHEMVGFKLKYWQAINSRSRHLEEKIVKGTWGIRAGKEKRESKETKERERNIFINTVRLLIALWIIVLVVTIVRRPVAQNSVTPANGSALTSKP